MLYNQWNLTTRRILKQSKNPEILKLYTNTSSNWEKCLNRYTWRHDSVLNSFLLPFSKILKTSSKIYCDSNKLEYNTTSQLFTTQHPDIAILDGDEMTVIELAICFETNTLKSKEYTFFYKNKLYKNSEAEIGQKIRIN